MASSSFQRVIGIGNRSIQVNWSWDALDPAWDEFVCKAPGGHHEQTALWGDVRSRYGWKVGRLVLTESSQIVAGAQVMVRRIGRFAKWAYVTYGPCFLQPDPRLVELVLKELKRLTRTLGATFLVLGLPYESLCAEPQLRAAGFLRKPQRFPPQFLEATVAIDLTQDSEMILGKMRPSTRRNIRHAAKKGLEVVQGDGKDIPTFHRLMVSLCERRKTSPNPAELGFFQLLWNNLAPKGWVKVFLTLREKEPISAGLAFAFNDWFRVWKVGWSGEHGELKPNEALWWHMIQHSQQAGISNFDFVSIDPNPARAILEGRAVDSIIDSVTSFKLGFGGQVKLLPGAFLHFPNPLLCTAARMGLVNWVSSSMATRFGRSHLL